MTLDVWPHDAAAEAVLLGSALMNDNHAETVCAECQPSDFHVPMHRAVFTALRERLREKEPVSLAVLARESKCDPAAVAGLVDGLPRIGVLDQWLGIVREKSTLRALAQTAREIEQEALGGATAAEAIDRAHRKVMDVSQRLSGDGFVDQHAVMQEAYDWLQKMSESEGGLLGLSTGLPDLDERVGGLRPAELILIGAETSKGKSALGVQIGEHAAKMGKAVAMFSLEMSAVQLSVRRICAEAKVSSEFVRFNRGDVARGGLEKLFEAAGKIAFRKFWIDQTTRQTVAQVQARSRRKQVTDGLDLVIVDYAQLISASKRYDNRTSEMAEVAYGLLGMAKDLNVPVVAMAQLNRAPSSRSDGRPRATDLKESSYLEQAADVVLLIWHDESKGETATPEVFGNAEIIVAKNRNGSTGTTRVCFNRFLAKFESAARAEAF